MHELIGRTFRTPWGNIITIAEVKEGTMRGGLCLCIREDGSGDGYYYVDRFIKETHRYIELKGYNTPLWKALNT
jgi:hypothetical protein